jgi:hypothetical protein
MQCARSRAHSFFGGQPNAFRADTAFVFSYVLRYYNLHDSDTVSFYTVLPSG